MRANAPRSILSFATLCLIDLFSQEGKRYDMSFFDNSIKRKRKRDTGLEVFLESSQLMARQVDRPKWTTRSGQSSESI